jgi:hypothetical protein
MLSSEERGEREGEGEGWEGGKGGGLIMILSVLGGEARREISATEAKERGRMERLSCPSLCLSI